MIYNPSIVTEGASEAADWIPFAKAMLLSMVSDGTRNSSPQDKITIVVTRHGSVAKIYIRAEYPKGGVFTGEPYDDIHAAGWGFREDDPMNVEAGYKGIEVIDDNRAVIFNREFSNSEWGFERYPDYFKDYPEEVVYGNLDWTSENGADVLTWKGINTRSYAAVPNSSNLQWSENCCEAAPPSTEWYAGLAFPGMVLTDGKVCDNLASFGPYSVTSPAGGKLNGDFAFTNEIFQGGELLIQVSSPFLEDGNSTTGIMGAAIHVIEDETTGEKTTYLVAVIAAINVYSGINKEALYIANYNDLSDYKIIQTGFKDYAGDTYIEHSNLNAWEFDSTGKRAIVVRRYQGENAAYEGKVVHELTINDDHTISIDDLWEEANEGLLAVQEWRPVWGLDEHAEITGDGSTVVAVGYDVNDNIRYATVGGKVKQDQWNSQVKEDGECDITYGYTNTEINYSLAFSNSAAIVGGNIIIQKATSKVVDFEKKDVNPPYWTTLRTVNDDCVPLYIDCRRDIFVGQRVRIEESMFRVDHQAAGLPYVNPNFADPESGPFKHSTTIELWIEGSLVYESPPYIELRIPGDCSDFTGEDTSRGQPICFPSVALTQADVDGDIIGNITTRSDLVYAFAQVQTSGGTSSETGFDIMVSARNKHAEADVICFLARWNGVELIDMQEIEPLLELGTHGFVSKTGKL